MASEKMTKEDVIMGVLDSCDNLRRKMVKDKAPSAEAYLQLDRVETLCLSDLEEKPVQKAQELKHIDVAILPQKKNPAKEVDIVQMSKAVEVLKNKSQGDNQ